MKTLKAITLFVVLCSTAYYFIGCSQEAFSGSQSTTQTGVSCSNSGQSCTTGANGVQSFNYSITAPNPSADILFVIDDAASMSPIQEKIGSRFPTLVQAIASLDYHIAVTTTDIGGPGNPPGPANGNGNMQNGNLLTFGNGSQVLVSNGSASGDAANESLFLSTIQIQQTVICEQYLASHNCEAEGACSDYGNYCPTDGANTYDNRGIYAANLAITANQNNWMRANVPLGVVIISNQDERGSGGRMGAVDQLQPLDLPASLGQTITQAFGSSKTLSVHSIVIDPQLNSNCMSENEASIKALGLDTNLVFGWVGQQYIDAAEASPNGSVGDICASDYAQQMGAIGASIADQLSTISLACQPINNQVQVTLTPADSTETWQLSGTTIQFAHPVAPQTQINLQFQCQAQ